MNYLLLVVGFVILIKCADWFVEGSVMLSERFGVPSLIIGLTIVAMGTSAPEAAVSVTAALDGSNGIAIGNVIGSNIFNLLMVLGISAIIKPLYVNKRMLKVDYPILLISIAVVGLMSADFFMNGVSELNFSSAATAADSNGIGNAPFILDRIDGIILLAMFAGFISMTVISAKKAGRNARETTKYRPALKKGIMLLAVGIAGIIGGGKLVVYSAGGIAASFGLSDNLIGLTIVAIGTSLPELVTSAVAAKKDETDIAVGNVVGSNIFNILFVLSISIIVNPIAVGFESIIDCAILLALSLIALIPFLAKRKITLSWGMLFIFLYILYTIYIIRR